MSEYTEPAVGDAQSEPSPDVIRGPSTMSETQRWSRKVIGPFTVRHLLVLNTVIAVALVILFAVLQPLGTTSTGAAIAPQSTFYRVSSETQGLEIGQIAPDFVGIADTGKTVRLTDIDGHPVSMADLKGHSIWVNFWATWCPPCRRETPALRAAYEAHRGEGPVLLGISIQEEPETVRAYVATYGLTYTIGMDVTAAVMHTYHVFGIPTHYFIDRGGVIRDRVFGPLDPAGIEQRLAEILKP